MPNQLLKEIVEQGVPLWSLVLFALFWTLSFGLLDYLFKRRLKHYETELREQLSDRDRAFQDQQKERDARLQKEMAELAQAHQKELLAEKRDHDLYNELMSKRRAHIDNITRYLNEFHHAVHDHILLRDSDYRNRMHEFYQKARAEVRAGSDYLTFAYQKAVMAFTDEGLKVERAVRQYTEEWHKNLAVYKLPRQVIDALEPLIGSRQKVLDSDNLRAVLSADDFDQFHKYVLSKDVTGFDEVKFGLLRIDIAEEKETMIHSLPDAPLVR